ncbi:MAG: hypothetical protein KIG50_00565 [Lachnospiraceae bacterium]|nr:hypothetical protein [Lachnospiraceae bacterium]
MAYKRQIAYMDLVENGKKKRNAGFCKWEQRIDGHVLFISIHGLPENVSKEVGVYSKSGDCFGKLNIRKGRAEQKYLLQSSGQDMIYAPVRIRIPIGQEQEIVGEFPVEEGIDLAEKKAGVEQKPEPEIEIQAKPESGVELEIEPEIIQEPVVRKPPQTLSEWLETSCEKFRPFGTKTEYYRIALEDIYHLKEEYHVLRNNQFLLHGYYNYHYLILGKKDGKETGYWLGVPGIYHEREKMAARMYGFEKFEGSIPKYGVGDLGYYLISAG